ncbi:hypothetical protein H7691_02525 [Stenotrophomonas sp. CW117]|jgi:hypothetical protein|uniref:hypothetical protein n=1 Tax=Stenotrophomonas TaxID=40323 RepID=UPI000ABF3E4F|nr:MULTISPECIES: hypothetical protein [Stenotrophomonas]QOF99051.1 hypothetical protein H7691_02525 [Stenotrophomonas sp. CW117]
MSNRRRWQLLRDEWRSNPRLRYGAMVILAILGMQGWFLLSDQVEKRMKAYASDMEMLARLEGVRKEVWWPERAGKVAELLQTVTGTIPEVAGKGMAQAESQAWLAHLVAEQKIGEPRVKVEDTVDVDGYPDMWQVISRLEGNLPNLGHQAFMHSLAEALPWVQVERIEIGEGEAPRVVVTLRSYYRKGVPAVDGHLLQQVSNQQESTTNNPDAADLAR